MNASSTRTCPFCAESISAAARVCPRCRQWLKRRSWRNPEVRNAVGAVLCLAALAALGGAGITALDRLFNPRPYYSEMPDALQVLETHMNWVQTTNNVFVYVTGLLTNRSAVAWKDVEFECRFYGPDGSMVDADHELDLLTVRPYDDAAFRVRIIPCRPASDYRGVKVWVTWARTARGFP